MDKLKNYVTQELGEHISQHDIDIICDYIKAEDNISLNEFAQELDFEDGELDYIFFEGVEIYESI